MKKQRKHGNESSPTLEELHGDVGNIQVPRPSEKMDERFRMMLDEEKRKDLIGGSITERKKPFYRHFSNPVWRIAAGISLFLMGWFGASWFGTGAPDNHQLASLSSEVVKLRETLVLSMIDQNSPVERIKAVNMMDQMEPADGKIIQSLLSTLENDENDNVRLIALDALIKYAHQPTVREGLINAISKQTSPMVQLRLAEIMVSLQ